MDVTYAPDAQWERLVAHMEQPAGPVYSAITRATYIAAHRAVEQRLLRPADLAGQLAKAGFEDVPIRTVQRWVKHESDLPERLISNGIAKPEHFPLLARNQLRMRGLPTQPTVLMEQQIQRVQVDGADGIWDTEEAGWLKLAVVAGLIWLYGRQHRRQAPPQQVRARRRMGLI